MNRSKEHTKTVPVWEGSIEEVIGAVKARTDDLATGLWQHPETSGSEVKSAARIGAFLAEEGFGITVPALADLPTSFVAEWGSGKPIIGLLGEYDALPGLSQEAVSHRAPVKNGGPGHGCGHNLLGAGLAGTAAAAKRLLEKKGTGGTIRYYGCPAEETLVGKVKLADAGLFDDCDLCLSWHPMSFTTVSQCRYAALISVRFRFHGIAGHAAESPELTRSASDALELMNVGSNYLREHIDPTAQIAYSVLDAGAQPNVVADFAEGWYYIRGGDMRIAQDVFDRVVDVANGAALMTGTTVDYEEVNRCDETRLSSPLNDVLVTCMEHESMPTLDRDETEFAEAVARTIPDGAVRSLTRRYPTAEISSSVMCDEAIPLADGVVAMRGSSDYSNVSQKVPCAQIFVSCAPFGTPVHSWQNTACAGSALGLRGMHYAMACLTRAIVSLVMDRELTDGIVEDFKDIE